MPKAVILSGGVTHDFPALAERLTELLAEVDVQAVVRTDIDAAATELAGTDLLVMNMLRWQMLNERYAAHRDQWGLSLSPAARAGISDFVHSGGAMLATHASSICFDDWPEWKSLCGARWDWDASMHPPVGPARVSVMVDRHPIVAGLPAGFDTDDEIYGFLDLADDVEPLLTGTHNDAVHPLLWARTVGAGRVVHNALGHYLPSYVSPVQQRIVRRSVRWLLGQSDDAVVAE
jgi:type 1 glutamine amidotransferase